MKVLVLGTSSDAGKTVVAAMICRHLARKGLDPAPFKASNLSLNSYATIDGGEIGIGQAFQAWACGIEPESDMNPVLMKPSGDGRIQIVLGGKPYADVGNGVRLDRDVAREQIMRSFSELSRRHGSVICEGSGSPAELNLLNCDLANTGLMRQLGIPAILVGDIERGGVFAAVYGTWRLIPDDVRPLLRGFVINRFRGDPSLLTSGIEEIERRTGMKCLGVLPYMHLRFPEEDSLSKSEGRFEGDDPHAAFVSNVDCMLDAAIESGFDFETLEKIGGRSSPGCDAEDLDDRVLGQNGVHGHLLQAVGRHIGVHVAVVVKHRGEHLHGGVAVQFAGLDQLDEPGQSPGRKGHILGLQALGGELPQHLSHDPVGRLLGGRPQRHRLLKEIGQGLLTGDHPGVIDGQAPVPLIPGHLGLRHLGDLRADMLQVFL